MNVKDAVREYWNGRPCNLRHSPAEVGSAKYFAEVRERKFRVEPHILPFAYFPAWRDKLVLEIGCGLGTTAVEFARHGAHVTAIDLSDESVELAKQNAEHARVRYRIQFDVADVETLSNSLLKIPYDLIWSFGVLHHTPDPAAALRELRKYAHAGTVLRIMVYHRWSLKALRLALSGGVRRQSEAQSNCPVTYVYSRREIRRLLHDTGWQMTMAKPDHIFAYNVDAYKQYVYEKHWLARMPFFRWLERRAGWHLLVEARIA